MSSAFAERYGLKVKKNGRRRTPSYDVSESAVSLKRPVDDVLRCQEDYSLTRAQAIELVAKSTGIPQNSIAAGCRDSHRSLRAFKKRLKESDRE